MFVKYDTFHMQPSGWPYVGVSNSAPATPPNVTSLGTTTGTEVGGTAVPINGTGFTGATAVQFGGVAAASFVVVSDILINAVTPALGTVAFVGRGTLALSSTASDNAVNVTVTNGAGSSTLAGSYTYTSEFARLAGSTYFQEFRFGDPRVGLNAGNVSSLPNFLGGAVNDLGMATAAQQPLFESTGWNGGPSALADGSDDYLVKSPLNPVIPSGNRPYVFIAYQHVGATANKNFASISGAAGSTYVRGIINGANYQMERSDAGSAATSTIGGPSDTNRHLFEMGFTAAGTDSFVMDGVTANNARTIAPPVNITLTSMFDFFAGIFQANGRAAWMLVLSDPPSAGLIAGVRAAAKTTVPWVGYTAQSLSLP